MISCRILLLVVVLSSSGCIAMKIRLNAIEYQNWYSSDQNVFKASTIEENIVFSIQLIPAEFGASELLINKEITIKDAKAELKEYDGQSSFKLNIQLPSSGIDIYNYNPSSQINIGERMRYFSFDFKNNISLISKNGDTIPCSNLLHERGMSGSPVGVFLLDFNQVVTTGYSAMIINDKALIDKSIRIDLSNWNIDQLPKLTY